MKPDQAVAKVDGKGVITIIQVSATPSVTYEQKIDKGGATVKYKVAQRGAILHVTELAVSGVQAFGTDGKPIPAAKLASLLAKEQPVLVSLDGNKVDPFHLRLIKEDTIVLVPPLGTIRPAGMHMHGYPIMHGHDEMTTVDDDGEAPRPAPPRNGVDRKEPARPKLDRPKDDRPKLDAPKEPARPKGEPIRPKEEPARPKTEPKKTAPKDDDA
jgi:hypothetical protein